MPTGGSQIVQYRNTRRIPAAAEVFERLGNVRGGTGISWKVLLPSESAVAWDADQRGTAVRPPSPLEPPLEKPCDETLLPDDDPDEAVPAVPTDPAPDAVDAPRSGSRSRIRVYPSPLTTRPVPLGCGSELPSATMMPGEKKPGL